MLDHADKDEVFGGVDPEPGAGGAAPVVLALGNAVGFHRVLHHGEVEAEALTGGELGNALGHLVAVHQLHRRGGQQAHAVQFAAIEQHLAEAGVVHGGGDQPAASGEEIHRRQVVAVAQRLIAGQHEGAVLPVNIDLGEAVRLFRRHPEAGVVHAQGIEYPLLKERIKRLAGKDFHQIALHVHRHAVVPDGAGLLAQGDGGEVFDHVAQGGVRVQDFGLPVELVHRGFGEDAVA